MRAQLLRTTTGLVPTKIEKMSPYFWERFRKLLRGTMVIRKLRTWRIMKLRIR